MKRFSIAVISAVFVLLTLQGCITDDQQPAQEAIFAKSDDESGMLPPETTSDLLAEQVNNSVTKEKVPALTPDDIEADADPLKIGFETAQWSLSEVAIERIKAVAERLKDDQSLSLKIDGHCDERGSDQYNQELSIKRAKAVERALIADGVPKKRLTTEGFGRRKALKAGHSEKVYSHNRRVEMIFSN